MWKVWKNILKKNNIIFWPNSLDSNSNPDENLPVMKNYSLIQENISVQKTSFRKDSCRDYIVQCQNSFYIYGLDSDGNRCDEYIEEAEGSLTKKVLLKVIKDNPEIEEFSIQGKVYSLDRTLGARDRWEHADLYDCWEVCVDRNLNII